MTGTIEMAPRIPVRAPGSWGRVVLRVWCIGAAVLLMAACGDDGGVSAPSSVSGVRRKNAPPPHKAQGEGDMLQFYTKVEDIVGPEEAVRIRHRFLPEDFEPDAAGNRNRDPFRSYVLRLGELDGRGDSQDKRAPEICKDTVAKNTSLRDLKLVGIVLRGTRSYALFMDSTSHGHIVTKGDCLGIEKASVSSVRAGFVSLEIIPEATQSQTAPEPQERIIPLYPNELLVEDGEQ